MAATLTQGTYSDMGVTAKRPRVLNELAMAVRSLPSSVLLPHMEVISGASEVGAGCGFEAENLTTKLVLYQAEHFVIHAFAGAPRRGAMRQVPK